MFPFRYVPTLLVFLGAALFGAAPYVLSSSNQTGLAIYDAVEAIQQSRQKYRHSLNRHQKELARVAEQVARLKEQLTAREADLATLKPNVDAARQELSKLDASLATQRQQIAKSANLIDGLAKQLHDRVEAGVPWDRTDRLNAIAAIRLELQRDNAIAQCDGMTAWFEFCSAELSRLRALELVNEKVAFGDREKHAYVVRLGLAGATFVTEDNHHAGLAKMTANEDWQVTDDPQLSEHIRRGTNVLRQVSAPELTPQPFSPSPQLEPSK